MSNIVWSQKAQPAINSNPPNIYFHVQIWPGLFLYKYTLIYLESFLLFQYKMMVKTKVFIFQFNYYIQRKVYENAPCFFSTWKVSGQQTIFGHDLYFFCWNLKMITICGWKPPRRVTLITILLFFPGIMNWIQNAQREKPFLFQTWLMTCEFGPDCDRNQQKVFLFFDQNLPRHEKYFWQGLLLDWNVYSMYVSVRVWG